MREMKVDVNLKIMAINMKKPSVIRKQKAGKHFDQMETNMEVEYG